MIGVIAAQIANLVNSLRETPSGVRTIPPLNGDARWIGGKMGRTEVSDKLERFPAGRPAFGPSVYAARLLSTFPPP